MLSIAGGHVHRRAGENLPARSGGCRAGLAGRSV